MRGFGRGLRWAGVYRRPWTGIFAEPALSRGRVRLHRSLKVDLPGGIADRLHFFGQFGTKAVSGQTDDAYAMNRALDLPQQPGQHRISSGLAAKESNLDAVGQILVDQHPDVLTVF